MTLDGLSILNQLEFFVALLDLEGNIQWLNSAAVNIGGRRLQSVQGTPFWDGPWFEKRRRPTRILRDMFDSVVRDQAPTKPQSLSALISGGIYLDIELHMTPYFDPATGELAGVLPHATPMQMPHDAELEELQSTILGMFHNQRVKLDSFQAIIDTVPHPVALISGEPPALRVMNAAAKPLLEGDEYTKPVLDWEGSYSDLENNPIEIENTPLLIAMIQRRPAAREFLARFQTTPNIQRRVRVHATPTEYLGEDAACVYWEEVETTKVGDDD